MPFLNTSDVKTGFWVTVGVLAAVFAVGLLIGLVTKR